MSKQPKTRVLAKSHFSMVMIEEHSAIIIQNAFRTHKAKQLWAKKLKTFKKKTNIAQELLETERTYLANIEILYDAFLSKLENDDYEKILGRELQTNLHLIASILKFIISCHAELFEKLQGRLAEWAPSTKLGDIFVANVSFLKSYTQYVGHYQPILRLLRARKNDVLLQKTLDSLVVADCKGKGLKDFLIMPVQRIPRYNMLLIDLLKKTNENHCDYDDLTEASVQVLAVCEYVEETSDKTSRMEKKMELATRITFPKSNPIFLAMPHRNYLWESSGVLTTTYPVNKNILLKKKMIVFAFSDLFVFCEEHKPELYKAIHTIQLDEIESFRAIRVIESSSINFIMLGLGFGECKIEELPHKVAGVMENFFLKLGDVKKKEEEEEGRYVKSLQFDEGQLSRSQKRRTVQISRNTSEKLPSHFRTSIKEHEVRPRAETTNILTPKIVIARTKSSKALKRTLSIGKFASKDRVSKRKEKSAPGINKIPKSASRDDIESRVRKPASKSRTGDKFREFSDLLKRGPRRHATMPNARKRATTSSSDTIM